MTPQTPPTPDELPETAEFHYTDCETLRALYREYSQREIAQAFGVDQTTISYHLRDCGIEARTPGRPSGAGVPLTCAAKTRTPEHTASTGDGQLSLLEEDPGRYLQWVDTATGETVYVHQLLAISKGADPHELFGGPASVRFRNGRRDDLRPENIEVYNPAAGPWRDREAMIEALEEHATIGDIAEAWDVNPSTVNEWRKRHRLERHYDPERGGWYVTSMDADDAAGELA